MNYTETIRDIVNSYGVTASLTVNVKDILDIPSTSRRYEVVGKQDIVLAHNSQFTKLLLKFLVE